MSAFAERRDQDIRKLTEMSEKSGGRIKLTKLKGTPVSEVNLELHYVTAGSNRYPTEKQMVTQVAISLPARYPFAEPSATISTPIHHPNVYSGGRICFGVKWLPTQGLDLLVQRIIQIVTFDPLILNAASPANGTALAWYRDAIRRHPGAFPSDHIGASTLNPPKMTWTNVASESAKTIVTCPACAGKLSLLAGKSGKVTCPKCNNVFETRT